MAQGRITGLYLDGRSSSELSRGLSVRRGAGEAAAAAEEEGVCAGWPDNCARLELEVEEVRVEELEEDVRDGGAVRASSARARS